MLRQQFVVFEAVAKDRAYSQGGPLPLSSRNLLDYFELHQTPKALWCPVTEFVEKLDAIWLEEYFDHAEGSKPPKT